MIRIQEPHLLFEKTAVYKISERKKPTSLSSNNAKSAKLLLVYAGKGQSVAPSIQAMFSKLTIACGFTEAEKMLINTEGKGTEAAELVKQYSAKLVLVFGESALNGVNTGKHVAQAIGGANVIVSENPEVLVGDDKGKAALWKAIKATF